MGWIVLLVLISPWAAAEGEQQALLDLTDHWVGWFSLIVFGIAYFLVVVEEFTELRKSKPVIIAAGLIWVAIAWVYASGGMTHTVEAAARHNLLEYAELMLFLMVAMTYINTLEEMSVFEVLRDWLIRKGFSFQSIFWITGILAFVISPIADNLTTALVMCSVVLAVGRNNDKFVILGCINIVVAANAGGAFSPFGDITTLMVWQKGVLGFWEFFDLLFPAIVNYFVPAIFMGLAVPAIKPPAITGGVTSSMKRGARRVIALFLATIATAVVFHNLLHLPPVLGMMTGLGYLQLFGYYLKKTVHIDQSENQEQVNGEMGTTIAFDVYSPVARTEWDTLFFFYGVVLCVGGLGFIGYLGAASELMYSEWGATNANIAVGILSAIVDNIPVMFAVLTMNPDMSVGQWLLVTLTAGVGGSLLSIGSAAGVALMGQAKGQYTFFSHLKWSPVILAGYIMSIVVHLAVNGDLF